MQDRILLCFLVTQPSNISRRAARTVGRALCLLPVVHIAKPRRMMSMRSSIFMIFPRRVRRDDRLPSWATMNRMVSGVAHHTQLDIVF